MRFINIFLFLAASCFCLEASSTTISVENLTPEQLAAILAAAGITATDTDECAKTLPVCHENAVCNNTFGSYTCTCETGFTEVSSDAQGATECEDNNECDTPSDAEDPCAGVTGSTCVNNAGSFTCDCADGYEIKTNGTSCTDIDECADETQCDSSGPSTCENSDGAFTCSCFNGYAKNDDQVCQDVDECTSGTHTCLTNQDCTNDAGSFTCSCKNGYKEPSDADGDCVDKDECVEDDTDPCAHITGSECSNNEGSFQCSCTTFGYQINTDTNACVDIDECDTTNIMHDCDVNEKCVNADGSYTCACADGYSGDPDADTCSDVNECDESPCDTNAICINGIGTHDCHCKSGFFGSGNKDECYDVQSCSTFDMVKTAIVTVQDAGESDDVSASVAILEQYAVASGKSDVVPGDTYRAAFPGDLDPDIGNVIEQLRCDYFSSCSEPVDSTTTEYTCICNTGYEFNTDSTTQCTDTDECATEGSCGVGATCSNNEGSYICECAAGYRLEGELNSDCIDIDECVDADVAHNCHSDATCTNEPASFSCTCNSDFYGTGLTCKSSITCDTYNLMKTSIDLIRISNGTDEDIDAGETLLQQYIATVDITSTIPADTYTQLFTIFSDTLIEQAVPLLICDYVSTCSMDSEGHSCSCNDGYAAVSSNPNQCIDINECDTLGSDSCGVTGTCVNNIPGYSCTCADGYEGGETGPCTNIDECTGDNHECGDTGMCEDNEGSYICNCYSGFEGGIAAACTNINECATGDDACHDNATCTDTRGSFECECNMGFEGNGTHCTDINECETDDDNDCDSENGVCNNNDGSFACSCMSGFMFSGVGNQCESATNCEAFVKIKTAVDELRTTTEDADANMMILQRYIDAEGKADGVSSDSYRLAYLEDIDDVVLQAVEALRCDFFSSCSVSESDSSYQCFCMEGYTSHPETVNQCLDFDECSDGGANNCHDDATCANTQGSFGCACKEGYEGNGVNCTDVNECVDDTLHTCDTTSGVCTNEVATYTCSCKTGYMGTGQTGDCADVLTCSTFSIVKNAIDVLQNTTDGDDISVAKKILQQYSSATGKAVGASGAAYRAVFGDDLNADIETVIDELQCDYFSSCTNSTDNSTDHTCTCNTGYEFYDSETTLTSSIQCTDIDECATEDGNNCHVFADCSNTLGSYTCTCNDGFFGSGITCSDHDECNDEGDGHDCDENAICNNINGGHTCTCTVEYYGNGTMGNCEEIATCETFDLVKESIKIVQDGSDDTLVNAARKVLTEYANAEGHPHNDTSASYMLEYGSDVDADILSVVDKLLCDYHSTCDGDTITCTCEANYVMLSDSDYKCYSVKSCAAFNVLKSSITNIREESVDSPATASREMIIAYVDAGGHVDPAASSSAYVARYGDVEDGDVENALDLIRCDYFSTCSHADDTYTCDCVAGYMKAETENSCEDMNECETTDNTCDINALCTNNEGSYGCTCISGFVGDGFACEDDQECDTEESTLCGSNAVCTDTVGSYSCSCSDGYNGDGTVCQEISSCVFNDDAVPDGQDCSDYGHPLSCSFEKDFPDLAETHLNAYRAFFKSPSELVTQAAANRGSANFVLSGVNTNTICEESTLYTSPRTAFTDIEKTNEVELFSYSCYRQWFVETECTSTPANINLACNTAYLPHLTLVIQQSADTGKYEVVPMEVYLPSSCKLAIIT